MGSFSFYFYLKIILLICFIFAISYFNTYMSAIKESFSSSNKPIILLGDSILKNNAYASDGKGIDDLLLERNEETYCYAVDNSNIVDIYRQINEIPIDLNKPSTTIFLSAGGNDILNHYHEDHQGSGDINDTSVLSTIFAAYKKMIKAIRAKMNQVKIVLLDIYYPDNNKYIQYHPIIKEWNNLIYEYANNPLNSINDVLKVSGMLTQNDDFTLSIEPSSSGGSKIANSILNFY